MMGGGRVNLILLEVKKGENHHLPGRGGYQANCGEAFPVVNVNHDCEFYHTFDMTSMRI